MLDSRHFATEIGKASNRQFHAKLFALAVAQDRQVHEFAGLGLFDGLSKVDDITCPLSVHRDDQFVRLADSALLKSHHAKHRGRKK
jgi:hypothetical protein